MIGKKRLGVLAGLFVALCFLGAAAPATQEPDGAQATDGPKVLFISSYSLAFPTVEQQIAGVRNGLDPSVHLVYEFMDTKEIDTAASVQEFYTYLTEKYAQTGKPDAVIAGDDSALELVLSEREDFFRGIPIAYEAVDSTTRAQHANDAGIPGVQETASTQANLELAIKLYPNATRLLAVLDSSKTGVAQMENIRALAANYPNLTVEILNTSEHNAQQIREHLAALTTDTILFDFGFAADGTGKTYTYHEAEALVADAAAVPIFYFPAGGGSLGGVQTDFSAMGRMAAQMVTQMLAGTPGAQIASVTQTPTNIVFDAQVLRKYEIPRRVLPANATYINDDETDRRVLQLSLAGGVILAILAVLLGAVGYDNRRKKRKEKELLLLEDQLRRESEHDPLTGLCNRRRFYRTLNQRLDRVEPTALFAFDLDGFKTINDTYGHQVGDEILTQAGQRLKAMAGSGFSVYRLGGDEFAAVLQAGELAVVETWGKRIQDAFAVPFLLKNETEIQITVSLGAARSPTDATVPERLSACADEALYYVKRNGKDGFALFEKLPARQPATL